VVTQEQVWNESRMFRQGLGGPLCQDCHLGNASSLDKEEAHKGMVSLRIISRENALLPLNRSFYPEIKNYSEEDAISLINNPEVVKTLLYHDRGKDFEPNISLVNKTCGKCHPEQFKAFFNTTMGRARMQSLYANFSFPAPHNCGYWLVNFSWIQGELAVNYTLAQAELNNRVCQQCHASCLDCHYTAFATGKKHSFSRKVSAKSCYFGGGRGLCHLGAEQYRRGSGYFRSSGGYSRFEDDIHATQLICTDCHTYDNHKIERKATCRDCHLLEQREVKEGVHANLSCEACHISGIAGYMFTFWGDGNYYGMSTPLAKLNSYGVMDYPVLIRDQEGRWIPTKPMPQAVMHLNHIFKRDEEIKFRVIPGLRNSSEDAYYVLGSLPSDRGYTLVFIHMDKISHGFGKGRKCEGCHSTSEQIVKAFWYYPGEHTGEDTSFSGESTIIANSSGIFIKLENTTTLSLKEFIPLLQLNWHVPGDFSLPSKSKYCGDDCISCHRDYHKTISPVYMKKANYIKYFVFFVSAILLYMSVMHYRRQKV